MKDSSHIDLIYSFQNWPKLSDCHLLYNINSDDLRKKNLSIIDIIDHPTEKVSIKENDKFLDYGCGEGFCLPLISEIYGCSCFGYDIIKSKFWSDSKKIKFFSSFEKILENGPYDSIMIHDVLDKVEKESPIQFLKNVSSLLARDGKIYMRCYPWISMQGGDLSRKTDRAFAHLVFKENSEDNNLFVVNPLKTYANFFSMSNLKMIYARKSFDFLNSFFKENDFIKSRIIKNTGQRDLPEFQMSIKFIDYCLEKY